MKKTETIETPEQILEQDAQVIELNPEGISYHPILMIWDKVLEPAAAEADAKITPQWAVRITSTYPNMRFRDMGRFQELYFGMVDDLHAILLDEIKGDREALSYDNLEDDRKENREHYIALLTKWQVYILQRELDWHYLDEDAEIKLAALSEVHKLFLGEQGLTGHLEQIGFDFTDADQETLSQVLAEARGEGVNGE